MAASKFRISSGSFTSFSSFTGSVVFASDVTVGGTLNVHEMKTTLVSSSIIFKSGSTKFGDTADDLHQFTGSVSFSSGLSGSLHHLADGTSYLVAGENITIASSSNGSIAITSTDTNTTYTAGSGLDLAGTEFSLDLKSASGLKITSGELAVEPADFVGTGLEDDGSDNIRINNSVVATISGSTFTGATKHNLGLSGSLHHLADGTSYLIAGANITIASASNGAVTISGAAGGGGGTPGGSNTQVQFNDSGGFGGDAGLVYNKSSDTLTLAGVLIVSGAAEHASDVSLTQNSRLRFNNPGQNDIFIYANSDNALRIDGDDSVDFNADTSFSFTANSNSITVDDTKTIINSGATSADFYANTSNYFGTVFVDGGDNTVILGNQSFDSTPVASEVPGYGTDVKIYISGTVGTKGTSTRGVTLIAGDSIVSGTLYAPNAISGSLTKLTDGTSYLVAGTNVTITTASNGSIAISSTADQNVFSTIAVSGQTNVVADAATDTLTFAESGGMTITTTAGTDTVTFSSANTTYTAGDGLDLGGTEFSLDLKSSGGLKIVSTELAIEPANFAGTGLEDDGSDNLRIASSAAGSGLTGGGASALSVGAGTGMLVNANDIAIDNGVVATISGSAFTGPITFSQNAVTASTILDTSNNTLLSLNSAVVLNEDGGDIDFRVESANKAGMLILDAGTDQILFNNSPASRFAADEAFGGSARGGLGTDTGVYISGSRGSIGSATSKGVTTIVGDLVVSGNIFHNSLGNTNNIFLEANQIATNKIVSNDPAAPFAQGRDTNTYIEFGGDQIEFYAGGVKMLTFDEGATDHITFNDGGLDVNFRVETNNLAAAIHADGGTDQVVIGGNTATITNYLMGTDTNILLSGTIGSKGTATKGTVVASGDMVVSGTFHNPGIVHVHVSAGAAQDNIAVDSLVQVQFGDETTDTHNAFASHTFTAPFDGHYLVNTAVMMHSIDTGADGYQLYLSGTNITPGALLLDSFAPAERFPGGDTSAAGGSTFPNTLKGSSTIYMPKNAVLSVFVFQSGGNQQTDLPRKGGTTALGVDGSNLSITKIG